ncbi:hypothetical protein L207DRAFT_525965 [Hyaloscypha variabilis F]|uniref:Uncharacterized protein n=1 Tax=Hyaloscypha variabilis (strain UAMH 11265 / GT02V1 / F) TaxID=1149755 RepID=A0A2J6S1L7_HYAVF|nr:hypothetical protein L207DRAFT_525965 [Hyaloscypha variabilis F]
MCPLELCHRNHSSTTQYLAKKLAADDYFIAGVIFLEFTIAGELLDQGMSREIWEDSGVTLPVGSKSLLTRDFHANLMMLKGLPNVPQPVRVAPASQSSTSFAPAANAAPARPRFPSLGRRLMDRRKQLNEAARKRRENERRDDDDSAAV